MNLLNPARRYRGSRSGALPKTAALAGILLLVSACESADRAAVEPLVANDAGANALVEAPGGGAKAVRAAAEDPAKSKPKAGSTKAVRTVKQLTADLNEAKVEKVQTRRKAGYAETELTLAELGIRKGEIEAAESLRKAREGLTTSREAMSRFEAIERPIAMQDASLDVDQAEERLLKAKTDLDGIVAIMSEESEASAKDEILRRYERALEFARERYALASAQQSLKVESELPAKLAKLAGAVRAAEAGLAKAEIEAEATRRKAELSFVKATDAADDAKRDSKKASKKVDDLQKQINRRKKDAAPKKPAARKAPAAGTKEPAGDPVMDAGSARMDETMKDGGR